MRQEFEDNEDPFELEANEPESACAPESYAASDPVILLVSMLHG